MSFRFKQITLFVVCVITVVGIYVGGIYMMAKFIPPAVKSIVEWKVP